MKNITYLVVAVLLGISGIAQSSVDVTEDEYVVFYHHDVLGSPVATTDDQGRVLWYEHSQPYGKGMGRKNTDGEGFRDNAIEEAPSRMGYTGHTVDNTADLVYMKARYYDPVISRFYSNDPVGFTTANPMMFNRYAYGNNNPYRFTDPAGKDAIDIVYAGYQVNTGFGFNLPLGHSGVVLIDNETGATKYYEYGRYPSNVPGLVGVGLPANKGNIRTVPIPDVEISESGLPTKESLTNIFKQLSAKAGKGNTVIANYKKKADFKKMNEYVNELANNSNRDEYAIPGCNCYTFSDDVIDSGYGSFGSWFSSLFDSSEKDE